ncbi:MAG: hypothetical protein P4L64_11715 [Caulobacteraceae bacterium]|nr:hypothetical protein [Caulobacteraceae bacterium]
MQIKSRGRGERAANMPRIALAKPRDSPDREAMTVLPSRVAIAVPSGDMVHADFSMALAELCHRVHGMAVTLISVKSSIIALARNNAVDLAQKAGAEHLLFLDSDMVFPAGALHRLLAHQVDIVGATYVKRVAPHDLLGTKLDIPPADAPEGLIEMQRIPTGCLLIRMSVFERLSKPYFDFATDPETGVIHGEDYVFCDRARAAGFRIWCDAALTGELGHIGQRVHRLKDYLPKGAET